jgi:hypothetical protein
VCSFVKSYSLIPGAIKVSLELPNHLNAETYRRLIFIAVLGDDADIAVAEIIAEYYNQESAFKHLIDWGVQVTTADKKSKPSPDLFLVRTFLSIVPLEYRHPAAPGNSIYPRASDDSVRKALAFYRPRGQKDRRDIDYPALITNLQASCRLASTWTPEDYEFLARVARSAPQPLPLPTQDHLLSKYNSGELAWWASRAEVYRYQMEEDDRLIRQLPAPVNERRLRENMAVHFPGVPLLTGEYDELVDKAVHFSRTNALYSMILRFALDNATGASDRDYDVLDTLCGDGTSDMLDNILHKTPAPEKPMALPLRGVAQMESAIGSTGAEQPANLMQEDSGPQVETAAPTHVVAHNYPDEIDSVLDIMRRGYQMEFEDKGNASFPEILSGNFWAQNNAMNWIFRTCLAYRGGFTLHWWPTTGSDLRTFYARGTQISENPDFNLAEAQFDGRLAIRAGPTNQSRKQYMADKIDMTTVQDYLFVPGVNSGDPPSLDEYHNCGWYSWSGADGWTTTLKLCDNFEVGYCLWIPPVVKNKDGLFPNPPGSTVHLPNALVYIHQDNGPAPNRWFDPVRLAKLGAVAHVVPFAFGPDDAAPRVENFDLVLSKLRAEDLRELGFDVTPNSNLVFDLPPEEIFMDMLTWRVIRWPNLLTPTGDQTQIGPNTWSKTPVGQVTTIPTPEGIFIAAAVWQPNAEALDSYQFLSSVGLSGSFLLTTDAQEIRHLKVKTLLWKEYGDEEISQLSQNQAFTLPQKVPALNPVLQHRHGEAQSDTKGMKFTEKIAASQKEEGIADQDPTGLGTMTLDDLGEKYQFITSIYWRHGDLAGSIIAAFSLPVDILVTPVISAGIERSRYWRGSIKTRVTVNGSMFQQGVLGMFFVPCTTRDETLRRYSQNIASWGLLNGVTFRPGGSTTVDLEIPFNYPQPYINLSDMRYPLGTLFFGVLSAGRTGAEDEFSTVLTLSAAITDTKYQVPNAEDPPFDRREIRNRVKLSTFSLARPADPAKPGPAYRIGEQQSSVRLRSRIPLPKKHRISRETAMLLGDEGFIPLPLPPARHGQQQMLNRLASLVFGQDGVDLNSGGTSLRPFDQPTIGAQPPIRVNIGRPFLNQSDNHMYANSMSLKTAEANLAQQPIPRPFLSIRQLLVAKPTFFGRFSISKTDGVGKVVYEMAMGPGAFLEKLPDGGVAQLSAFEYFSQLGTFWRGGDSTIVLKFVFVSSRQTCRVAVTPHFGVEKVPEDVYDGTSQYGAVVAVSEECQEGIIHIPFICSKNLLQVCKGPGADFSSSFLGCLSVRILGSLQGPSTCADTIDVMVFISAGEDFRLYDLSLGPGDLSQFRG